VIGTSRRTRTAAAVTALATVALSVTASRHSPIRYRPQRGRRRQMRHDPTGPVLRLPITARSAVRTRRQRRKQAAAPSSGRNPPALRASRAGAAARRQPAQPQHQRLMLRPRRPRTRQQPNLHADRADGHPVGPGGPHDNMPARWAGDEASGEREPRVSVPSDHDEWPPEHGRKGTGKAESGNGVVTVPTPVSPTLAGGPARYFGSVIRCRCRYRRRW
jgi:hypothetical protein